MKAVMIKSLKAYGQAFIKWLLKLGKRCISVIVPMSTRGQRDPKPTDFSKLWSEFDEIPLYNFRKTYETNDTGYLFRDFKRKETDLSKLAWLSVNNGFTDFYGIDNGVKKLFFHYCEIEKAKCILTAIQIVKSNRYNQMLSDMVFPVSENWQETVKQGFAKISRIRIEISKLEKEINNRKTQKIQFKKLTNLIFIKTGHMINERDITAAQFFELVKEI